MQWSVFYCFELCHFKVRKTVVLSEKSEKIIKVGPITAEIVPQHPKNAAGAYPGFNGIFAPPDPSPICQK